VPWGKVKEGRSGVRRHGGAAVDADEPHGEALSRGLNEGLMRVEEGCDHGRRQGYAPVCQGIPMI